MLSGRSRFDISGSTGDREVVTRTFKSLRFEPHARRRILIIRGELEISVAGVLYGEVLEENSQEFRKLIKLNGLNHDSNLRSVADDILEQCPFIPEDLLPQILGVLEALKKRKYDRNGFSTLSLDGESRGVPIFPEYFDDEDDTSGYNDDLKDVKMDSLDLYVELLYEDLQDKVKGARSLWKLTNASENLVTIFNHDTAINAVFRTLREDYRKSVELTSNLLHVILAFTKFHEFHPTLTGHKVNGITLDIIDFELTRYVKWVDEVSTRKELAEDPETTTPRHRSDLEKMRTKFLELSRKQDVLLVAAFDILKNMSESTGFREMKQRGLIAAMILTLDRSNIKLLTVAISFLANFSSFKEIVEEMVQLKVIEHTVRFLEDSTPRDLQIPLLQLYFNLTFATKLRFKMVQAGAIEKLGQLMDDPEFEGYSILTLYNISVDFKVRVKFATSEVIPKLVSKIVNGGGDLQLEAGALLLNLSGSKHCSAVICDNARLQRLVKIAIQRQDSLLMKVLRKLSSHPPIQPQFGDHVNMIVASMRDKSVPEFLIECLGTLSNLTLLELDYCQLLQGYQLLKCIRSLLQRPAPKIRPHAEDERSPHEALLLEVVIFLGTCGSEPSCADFLIQEGIFDLMTDLGGTPALDTDVRIQLFYTFYRMSMHTKTRNYMIEKTNMATLTKNFIRSECAELREISLAIWTNFGEYNDEWRDIARAERFLAHNEHWFEICNRATTHAKDSATLKRLKSRLSLEKTVIQNGGSTLRRQRDLKSSVSVEDSDDDGAGSEDAETDDDEDGDNQTNILYGRDSAQSEDFGSSSSEQTGSHSIFDQFKHQFNQEMVSRIYDCINEDQEQQTAVAGSELTRQRSSKSRPTTAHHSGRLLRNATGTSSSRVSFDKAEAHPKGMKPVIVNIKPKELW